MIIEWNAYSWLVGCFECETILVHKTVLVYTDLSFPMESNIHVDGCESTYGQAGCGSFHIHLWCVYCYYPDLPKCEVGTPQTGQQKF